MDVILLEDVTGLGARGATVRVANGYARNFLIPRNKAIVTAGNSQAVYRDRERAREKKDARQRGVANELRHRLSAVSLQFSVQVGDEDQLYGSVSAHDIQETLRAQGFEIERKNIRLDEPIKALGAFDVTIHLFQDIEAPVKVWVVRQ